MKTFLPFSVTSGLAFSPDHDYFVICWETVSQGCRKLAYKAERSMTSLKLNPIPRVTVDALAVSSVQHVCPRLDKMSKDRTNIVQLSNLWPFTVTAAVIIKCPQPHFWGLKKIDNGLNQPLITGEGRRLSLNDWWALFLFSGLLLAAGIDTKGNNTPAEKLSPGFGCSFLNYWRQITGKV